MIIDTKTYELGPKNFIIEESNKRKIIIGHTSSSNMSHFQKWTNRLNGRYKKVAHFTIKRDGTVYQHFDPIFCSEFLEDMELDKQSIYVLLENQGWLTHDVENNEFIDWFGNIYNKDYGILDKKWRSYAHWATYTEEQFESTLSLINHLCKTFFIPKDVIPHNVKIDNIRDFDGVMYRSNIEKHFTDLNPSWNFSRFKTKLDEYEE